MNRLATRAAAALALTAALLIAGPVAAQGGSPAANAPAAEAAKPTGPQPKAVMDETTFNAGDVPKGESVDHDFVIKNTGQADLMILSVKPACGCTAPDWTKVVPPGGTGKITLKVDTARFKGPISKTATVTTNDPEMTNLRLTVNADVKTFVDVLPADSATFRHYRGDDKKEELTIHSNEPGEFKINDVQVTGEGIKHSLAKADDGSGDYKLSVWLDKTAPIGAVAGSVKLLTNSAKEPEVTVNVRGTVLGQLSVNPSSLYFRVDGGGAPKVYLPSTDNLNIRQRGELNAEVVSKVSKETQLHVLEEAGDWLKVKTDAGIEGWAYKKLVKPAPAAATAAADQAKVLNVTHREESSFQITGTSIDSPKFSDKNLKVQSEAVKAGQSYRVTVTYAGGLEKGNYTGTLVIKTTDKDEPELKVPVYIVVA